MTLRFSSPRGWLQQASRPYREQGRLGRRLSGDHAKIAAWRRAEAERITRERRPDLTEF
jgi:tRNA (guanine37-N1)-methyltransferase